MKKARVIANVRVGKRQVSPQQSSHVRGVHQGNATALLKHTRNSDIDVKGDMATAKPTRSTGINAKKHAAIDPRMPNLTPP
jgi:hypothetical protein